MFTFNWHRNKRSRRSHSGPSRSFRPSLEALEPREVPSVTYISDSQGDLFTVVPDTGTTTYLGRMREVMTDLAADPGGQLWGVSNTNRLGIGKDERPALYRINSQNARITRVGQLPGTFQALGFRGNELFGATWLGAAAFGDTDIYRVSTVNAATQKVYTVPSYRVAGDLAFDGPGNLYLTTTVGDIIKVNSTFTGHTVVASTGLTNMYGLIYSTGFLYAFNTDDPSAGGVEKIYKIDPLTGTTTFVASITSSDVQAVYGAASAPETAAPLQASSEAPGSQSALAELTSEQWQPLLTETLARWTAFGVDTNSLDTIDVRIADLPDAYLGLASGNTIWLDDNAAGWGWFIDPTPWEDSEFTTPGNQGEQHRMDLLTALAHEIGHLLGQDHEDEGVMIDTLATGIRRLPGSTEVNDWSAFLDVLVSEPLSKRRW